MFFHADSYCVASKTFSKLDRKKQNARGVRRLFLRRCLLHLRISSCRVGRALPTTPMAPVVVESALARRWRHSHIHASDSNRHRRTKFFYTAEHIYSEFDMDRNDY